MKLKYVDFFEWTVEGCVTMFRDGATLESQPHDTHHYHVISHRTGYGDDVLTYCREHDFFHHFCAERFLDSTSPTLLAVAHGHSYSAAPIEEAFVTVCQRWVRGNERPIIGGVDWDEFRIGALHVLG